MPATATAARRRHRADSRFRLQDPDRPARGGRHLSWDSTTLVLVEVEGGGHTGLGYTYADVATAQSDPRQAGRGRRGPRCHGRARQPGSTMVQAIRNLGRPGIASMAISAVDGALWDLKARLLERAAGHTAGSGA